MSSNPFPSTFASPSPSSSLGTVKWLNPNPKGGPPTIKNHTVTYHNGLLYCFGGYDGHANHMSLLVYHVEKQEWTTVLSDSEVDDQNQVGRGRDVDRVMDLNINVDMDRHNNRDRDRDMHRNRGLRYHNRNHNNNHNHQRDVNNNDVMARRRGQGYGHDQRSSNEELEERYPYTMSGTPPPGRNGHTATLAKRKINNNNEEEERVCIFIIGGWLGSGPFAASDLHILDITNPEKLVWVPIQQDPDNSPGPCNMHSADFIPSKNEIYVFRGGNGCEYLNELHALNVDNLTWRNVETSGEVPQQRANHSSAFLEESGQLLIFGGWSGKERLNDLHILDTNTSTWSRPHVHGSLPHPRAGMSLTALRGKLYLFGGSGTSSKCFHDLHVLDPVEMTWLEVVQDETNNNTDDSGDNNNKNINKKKQNDRKCYNDFEHRNVDNSYTVEDWRSHELMDRQNNNISSGSSDEYLYASARSRVNAANPNEIENEPYISIRGEGPGGRAGHTATAVNRFIFVFGGSCGSDYLNDFFVLDTDPAEYPQVTNPTSQQLVGRKLKYLCNKEEFADVIFVVEGQQIYAHKMILALASDFYAAMFSVSNGFRETSSGCPEIDVPNCSYDAFLSIMEYIYSGNDPKIDVLSIDNVVDILQMADQLLLDHLKQRCEQLLQPSVDENSVEFLLQIAQKTSAMQLESVCNRFIRNHTTTQDSFLGSNAQDG